MLMKYGRIRIRHPDMEMPPFCPRLGDTEDLRDYKATDAEHKELRRKIRNRNKQRAYSELPRT